MWWIARVGRLPAVWVLLAFYVVAAAAALSLDDPALGAVAIALAVLLVGYCWARPRGGWNVFLIAAAPNALGEILEGVAGTPGWVPVLFVPIALLLVRAEDEDDVETAGSSAEAVRP